MTFTLELSDEDLLGELMGALAYQGCLTDRIGPTACRVVTPHGWTTREARLEIGLFVRAWHDLIMDPPPPSSGLRSVPATKQLKRKRRRRGMLLSRNTRPYKRR